MVAQLRPRADVGPALTISCCVSTSNIIVYAGLSVKERSDGAGERCTRVVDVQFCFGSVGNKTTSRLHVVENVANEHTTKVFVRDSTQRRVIKARKARVLAKRLFSGEADYLALLGRSHEDDLWAVLPLTVSRRRGSGALAMLLSHLDCLRPLGHVP